MPQAPPPMPDVLPSAQSQINAETILLLIGAMLLIFGVIIWSYLWVELRYQKKRQATRKASFTDSEIVKALTIDQQLSMFNYVLRNADIADRKRLVYQTFRNALMLVGGALPLASIMINNTMIQRIMSVGASIAVLVMGVFTIEANATNHRRTGYMIEMELESWRTEIGNYANKHDLTERFRELVKQVRTVLDSVETSFIGAGVDDSRKIAEKLVFGEAEKVAAAVPGVGAVGAVGVVQTTGRHSFDAIGPHNLEPELLPSQEEFQRMPIATPTAVGSGMGPPIPITPTEPTITPEEIDEFTSVFGEDGSIVEGEEVVEITQSGIQPVATGDWAKWQAEQFNADSGAADEPITITQRNAPQ